MIIHPNYRVILQVVLPLSFGVLIYLLFRQTDLLVFEWIGWTGMLDWIVSAKLQYQPFRPPDFVVYSLPGALWLYAFAAFLSMLWRGVGTIHSRLPWIVMPFLVAAASEGAQLLGFTDGTFDWQDVGAYAIALAASIPSLPNEGTVCPSVEHPGAVAEVWQRHCLSFLSTVCFTLIIGGADVV